MTLSPTEALQNYVAAWNATDADACSSHLLAACSSDVVLIDPSERLPIQGWGAIAGHIASFRDETGHDLQLEAASPLDAHHGVCRLSWQLADGPDVRARGIIVAEAAADGRLKRVIHFVDAA